MALIKRLVKGSPLTFAEGDANLDYLESLALSGSGVNINTGSLATTGSNTFTGGQTAPSFTGSLFGTASNALTASYALNIPEINTGSLLTTASFNAFTSSYRSGSFSGSFTGSLSGTANNANFSAYTLTQNSSTNGDFTFLFVVTGSNGYLQTYSDATPGILYNPSTNQLKMTGSLFGTSSLALTASYWSGSVANAVSASFASTASYWSGSVINAESASFVSLAQSASYWSGSVINAVSSSFASTASYWSGSVANAASASFASTASYWSGSIINAESASYALTASYALNGGSGNIDTSSFVTTSSFDSFTTSNAMNIATLFAASASLNSSANSLTAATSSYVRNSQTSSMSVAFATTATSASYFSGSISNAISASHASTASYWSGSINNALSSSFASTASLAPLYLPLAGGNMTGDINAISRTFMFQYLILGYGTTQGRISTDGGKNIEFYPTNTVQSTRFWANGNVTIQTGGTYTDNGFKLDVSGSGRYTNGLTVTGSNNFNGNQTITGSLAVTGLSNFNGNQSITGSLTVSSVAVISSSISANSSSLTLNSGSNLFVQNGGIVQISGSFTQSGSLVSIGPSTFTGSFAITGSSTLTGSLNIMSGSITMPNRPAFRVIGSGSTNIAAVAGISGSLTSIDYNEGGYYNNASGIFTAPLAGLYQVYFNGRVGNVNSQMQVIVYKNGNVVQLMWETSTNTGATHFGVSGIFKLAANDTLEAKVAVGTIQFDGNDSWGATYIG